MPTPLEILLDPVSLTMLGIYGALVLVEALFPARRLPRIPGWHARALAVFAAYFLMSSYLPLLWGDALATVQLFDLQSLHPVAGAAIGVLLFEFFVYVYHRTVHSNPWLWRMFHQMHHSAERVDTFGAFYFSPLDIVGFTFLSSLALSLIGLPAQSVTWTLYVTLFLAAFQHTNVRTPQWLGYFVQRPESHSVHHGRGIHGFNYSDLPLYDLLFGTFRNPRDFVPESGFEGASSAQIVPMLLFKDIAADAAARSAADAAQSPASPEVPART
jgi:sterol desaturase/sphingolipid hydroxylase (fatty acid hydroxylase superfamily)